jgi:hypothetical protein
MGKSPTAMRGLSNYANERQVPLQLEGGLRSSSRGICFEGGFIGIFVVN